jgi:predicted protein tyrosine phosphatase
MVTDGTEMDTRRVEAAAMSSIITGSSDRVPVTKKIYITDCITAEVEAGKHAGYVSAWTDVLSIWDRGTHAKEKYPHTRGRFWTVMEFDDVERDLPDHGYVAPTEADVRAIIALTWAGGPRVIHCAAGVSRSSAAAWIIFVAGGHSPLAAYWLLRHCVQATKDAGYRDDTYIRPNYRMIEIADKLLEQNGKFIACWHDHFLDRPWARETDY